MVSGGYLTPPGDPIGELDYGVWGGYRVAFKVVSFGYDTSTDASGLARRWLDTSSVAFKVGTVGTDLNSGD